MSKIGNKPISLPTGVTVGVATNGYTVKGPKGELTVSRQSGVDIAVDSDVLTVQRTDDELQSRANHGLLRSLLANAVVGVTQQFSKTLELVGVGYRVKLEGNTLAFSLGYSHPVDYPLPVGLSAVVPSQTSLTLTGNDKQQVGQVAAEIRALRPPEPYKGKGIRYTNEKIVRKAGKSGGKK